MAASSPPPRVESLSKPVQGLVISGEQVPEKYIYRSPDYGPIGPSFPVMELPVIDLSLLTSSSPTEEQAELDKLRSALSSWGCFQAINHGMADSFLDQLRQATKKFFALPMEEKQKYSRSLEDYQGYGNDTVLTENQTLDWTDRLYLVVCPEDQQKLQLWPENPENFRDVLHEYTEKLGLVTEIVLKAMARSLSLEDNCFLDQCRAASLHTRFNFYPICPRPDLILGVKPHADGSAITFLLPDREVEGLQILKDGHWIGVPIIPQALVINLGDQSEIMSNGIFKSPLHRVVTNTVRERISVATFVLPHPDQVIEPANGLISEQRPRLYKKMKDYVNLFFENYQQGKRPIDILKI